MTKQAMSWWSICRWHDDMARKAKAARDTKAEARHRAIADEMERKAAKAERPIWV